MRSTKHAQRKTKRHFSKPRSEFKIVPENLWRMRIPSYNEFEYCSPPNGMVISRGDFVVASTQFGADIARILGPVGVYDGIQADQVRRIMRIATDVDFDTREHLAKQEKIAYTRCRERISKFGLAMQLVEAHFVLDGNRLVFFFTAEGRIDFRELVQDLSGYFEPRIELRQIGIRDSARMIGGMGVCGRPYCCHGMTDRLSPVSITMAKTQNLSLNSLKISGACGRLFCCLAYENDHYVAGKKQLPARGCAISYEGMNYVVSDVNICSSIVVLVDSDSRQITIPASRFVQKRGQWQLLPENDGIP